MEMRTGKSPRWQGLGLVNGTSVKKKNLSGRESYHFRVKPLGIGACCGVVWCNMMDDRSNVWDFHVHTNPPLWLSIPPHLLITSPNPTPLQPKPDIDDAEWAWSPGSEGLSSLTLAPHIRTLLGSELVGQGGAAVLVEALAGKVVGA